MALLTLLIATLSAMFTCFFSFGPGGFHGLVPWIGPRPSAPPPSPAPFVVDLWDSVPVITNISLSSAPPPPLIFPFVEEEDEAEELLRELWSLLREALQRLTTTIDGFIKLHPCLLAGKNPVCRLRPCWPFPRVARSRRTLRARVRFVRAGSRSPPAPTPAVAVAAAVATFSPSPSTSPAPLVSSPAPVFSSPASPAPLASPPTPPSPLVSPLEHLRLINEVREWRNEILALEDKVQRLVAKLVDMQRVPPPSAPPPCPAPPLRPSVSSLPPSAPLSGQPGFGPGSAPPPLRPSVPSFPLPPSAPSFPPSAPSLRPSAPSFSPHHIITSNHVATPLQHRPYPPPPPPPPPQQRFGYPQGRQDLLSPEEFFKQYPQTGTKGY